MKIFDDLPVSVETGHAIRCPELEEKNLKDDSKTGDRCSIWWKIFLPRCKSDSVAQAWCESANWNWGELLSRPPSF